MWDGVIDDRDSDHGFLGSIHSFLDGFGDVGTFAQAHSNFAFLVANHNQSAETHAFAAGDHARDTLNFDDFLFKLSLDLVLGSPSPSFSSLLCHKLISNQYLNPASRAASAKFLMRPWYWYPPRSKTASLIPAFMAFSAASLPTSDARSDFVAFGL
jgi:hypothetical protein